MMSTSPDGAHPLKVCYFGTYRDDYSRNRVMMEGLRRNGVEVSECHVSLWKGVADRVNLASGGWISPDFWWRVVKTYTQLFWKYLHTSDYDILVVGYPGQFDIYLAWIFAMLKHKPVVLDIFMSIYLIALERGLDKKSTLTIKFLYLIEYIAFRLPNLLIQDTSDYVDWLCKTYHLDAKRFSLVPTGADDQTFHLTQQEKRPNSDNLYHILYYGTFIPNHGVPLIIEAAKFLKAFSDVHFILIGEGPDHNKCLDLVKLYDLDNVEFLGWKDKTVLIQYIAECNLCLGAFGKTPQSLMTIQNKIFEGLAMKKPVITGDSPIINKTFVNGLHLLICERDPYALAQSILKLKSDPTLQKKIAESGYLEFKANYSIEKIGERFLNGLIQTIKV